MFVKRKKSATEEVYVPYEEVKNDDFIDKLPPGTYYPQLIPALMGPTQLIYNLPSHKPNERVVEFSEGVPLEVTDYCDKFFTKKCKDIFSKLGIAHKLGVLLYGKQGTGKTTIANIISKHLIVNNNAIVLDMSNTAVEYTDLFLRDIRSRDPEALIVVIYDEFEYHVARKEEYLLKILDGNLAFDNVLYLATTNYIDSIPARIKNRPSRFRLVKEINAMPEQVYLDFIKDKLKQFDNNAGLNILEIAHLSVENACTIDELKHIIVELVTTDTTFEKSLSLVRVCIKVEDDD